MSRRLRPPVITGCRECGCEHADCADWSAEREAEIARLDAAYARLEAALREIAVPLIKHDGNCFAAAHIAAAALAGEKEEK